MAEDLQTPPEAVGAPTGEVPVTAESPPPRPRTVQLEPEHIGPYRILERVGEGGMGLVYKAEQRHPVRRVVALKVIKLGMDTRQVVARFEAERQALAMLSHPNVAKVLDAGMTNAGRPYFAMEFVPGVPLCEYCDQNKLTVRERIELFIPVCHAIQHAHQKGIIHRDLKPSNILVTMFDGHPVPKVIDFGIAKATNQQLAQQTLYTQTGAMVGTPEYMSPEQAMTSGLDVDTRTDIYSLGVILYELLTGCLPFDPEELRKAGAEGMARIIRETEPQWPSTRLARSGNAGGSDPATLHRTDRGTLQRQIRGDLDWITLKAMAKDRTRRYETANGLAVDLKRYLDDEPVLARPPSASYRASKFLRKHKVGVVAAGAVVAALVLGIVGTTAALVRERQARDAALRAGDEAQRQRAVAELARDDANAAARFLRDMFVSINSSGSDSMDRMRPVMRRLDEGWLAQQPENAIACRVALGFTFMNNNPTEAERQFNDALAMAKIRGLDGDPELTAAAYQGLGYVSRVLGDWATAEKNLRQAAVQFQHFRTPPAELGYVYMDLAEALDEQQKPQQAKSMRMKGLAAFISAKTADIASRPNDADLYLQRAKYLLRAGHFKSAAVDLARAMHSQKPDHLAWYDLAVLQLHQGDEAGYRSTAADMLRRFGNSARPEERERTAKVCLLTPRIVGDLDHLRRLVDFAMGANTPANTLRGFHIARGLLEFRQGEWRGAIWALSDMQGVDPAGSLTGQFINAMLQRRIGHEQQAKVLFERAERAVKQQIPAPGTDDLGPGFESQLILAVVRREAEQDFATRPPTAAGTNHPS